MVASGGLVERVAPLYGPRLLFGSRAGVLGDGPGRFPSEPLGVARGRALFLVTMAAAAAVLVLLVTLAAGLAQAATSLEIRVLRVGAAVMVAWIMAGHGGPAPVAADVPDPHARLRYPQSHVTSDGARCDRLHG